MKDVELKDCILYCEHKPVLRKLCTYFVKRGNIQNISFIGEARS